MTRWLVLDLDTKGALRDMLLGAFLFGIVAAWLATP